MDDFRMPGPAWSGDGQLEPKRILSDRLDSQLAYLENLVVSLEALEKEIEAEVANTDTDDEAERGNYPSDPIRQNHVTVQPTNKKYDDLQNLECDGMDRLLYKAGLSSKRCNGSSSPRHTCHLAAKPQESDLLVKIEEKLNLPDKLRKQLKDGLCDVCETHVNQLKQETVAMVQSLERTQAEMNPGLLVAKHALQPPRTTPHYNTTHHRVIRQGSYHHPCGSSRRGGSPHPHALTAYDHQNSNHHAAWVHSAKKAYNQMIVSGASMMVSRGPGDNTVNRDYAGANGVNTTSCRPSMLPLAHQGYYPPGQGPGHSSTDMSDISSPRSTSSAGSNPSAAASFFARAAQKLNISSRRKKRKDLEQDALPFPTNFSDVIRNSPPPVPPCLMRTLGRPNTMAGSSKVKVMLRICPVEGSNPSSSFLRIDSRKKQATIYDPAYYNGYTAPSQRRAGPAPPKMFPFDSIFLQDDSLAEVCSASLVEIVQAVVGGSDGCLFCYGHARLGKTYTMIGVDDSPQNLGIIPCAIAWLFKLINEQKDKSGARFSVRVSAVEVTGKQETLKDLLADVAGGMEAGSGTAPGVYLREDPISGTHLENQSELRAPTADRAAFYLDAAVAARTVPEAEEDARNSHLLITLHVYQYRVEKSGGKNKDGVSGGRSRLHLIDLGSCSKSSKDGQALSLSALGNVILALLNGQRHIPNRDSKLTQLIRDALSVPSCRTCMIAHVSPFLQSYNETLQVIQLAARVHRMRVRRKSRFSSSSEDSSDGGFRSRRVGVRMGTLREGAFYSSHSDPDYTSSSEQSCDTVIYMGANGQALSDSEVTDNERPPMSMHSRLFSARRTPGIRSSDDEANPEMKTLSGNSGEQPPPKPSRPSTPKCGATIINSRLPAKVSSQPSSPAKVTSPSRIPPHSGISGPPTAANSGVVQLPRALNVKTKSATISKLRTHSKDSKLVSVDRPNSSRTNIPEGTGNDASLRAEQWIDGPGVGGQINSSATYYHQNSEKLPISSVDDRTSRTSAVKQSTGSEHWIDGPNVGSLDTAPVNEPVTRDSSEQWIDGPNAPKPDVTNGELWVDGPAEFQISHSDARSKQDRSNKMWKESPRHHSTPKKIVSDQRQSDAVLKETVKCKASKCSRPVQSIRNPTVTSLSTDRPVSQVSADSSGSMAVQVDSRPVSIHGGNAPETTNTQEASETWPELTQLPVKSNPFVRDWVEKHSVAPTDLHGKSADLHGKSKRDSPKHIKNPQLRMERVGFGDKGQSPERQSGSAHSSPRVRRCRKGNPPTPAATTNERTVAWVKSVQCSTRKQSAEENNNPPPTYESCVEGFICDNPADVSFVSEATTQEGVHTDPVPQQTHNTSGDNGPVTNATLCTDGELISSKMMNDKNENFDVNELLLTNRESIYELQMDENLEQEKGDSSHRMTFGSEEDAWSSGSFRKDFITHFQNTDQIQSNNNTDKSKLSEHCIDEGVCALGVSLEVQNEDIPTPLSPLTINADAESGIALSAAEHPSPPSSGTSDKSATRKIVRPTFLRCPDGASNPNLSTEDPPPSEKTVTGLSPEQFLPLDTSTSRSKIGSPLERTVTGQSPDTTVPVYNVQVVGSPVKSISKMLPVKSIPKPTVCSKPTSPPKPSVLPKPLLKKSPVKSPGEKPAVPPRTCSKLTSPTKQDTSSRGRTTVGTPIKPPVQTKPTKEKSHSRLSKSASPSPTSPGHVASPASVRSQSSKSSRLPFFSSRSKSQTSPTKSSSSSGKESKGSRGSIKSPSPSKRDKETRLPVTKVSSPKITKPDSRTRSRMTDSDSGNDSGIVKNDKKLLSPYSKLTKARSSMHSTSSGHGSDNSSTFLGRLPPPHPKAETSSGYESMIRDSEITGTSSSTQDSTSESSSGGRVKGTKIFKKKTNSSRRSRSAPPRTPENSMSCSRVQSPASTTRLTLSPASPRAWVDTRRNVLEDDQPMEIKVYDFEDVERMTRRRREEAEMRALEKRRNRVRELLSVQADLKAELAEAKDMLMVEKNTWSFDLHVAEQLERDEPGYLEALEKETDILYKRVQACKSRIMLVTCFDI